MAIVVIVFLRRVNLIDAHPPPPPRVESGDGSIVCRSYRSEHGSSHVDSMMKRAPPGAEKAVLPDLRIGAGNGNQQISIAQFTNTGIVTREIDSTELSGLVLRQSPEMVASSRSFEMVASIRTGRCEQTTNHRHQHQKNLHYLLQVGTEDERKHAGERCPTCMRCQPRDGVYGHRRSKKNRVAQPQAVHENHCRGTDQVAPVGFKRSPCKITALSGIEQSLNIKNSLNTSLTGTDAHTMYMNLRSRLHVQSTLLI